MKIIYCLKVASFGRGEKILPSNLDGIASSLGTLLRLHN